ncbi:MAG TPA: diguanylate cyclase [Syntrophales bacterium]|nr:diguanylate cyclase [Syntrophales bacterium]
MKTEESKNDNAGNVRKDNSPRILVVDDNPEMLTFLTDILTNYGYRVSPFSNGHAVLKSVIVEVPDLILLDIIMPDMDGFEVCHHLKSDERSCMIPVIFISGLEEVFDKVKGFEVGGVDYITKPFRQAEVLARVDTHLSLRSLQKQLEVQNIRLQEEITERERVEEDLRKYKADLEDLVVERTAELGNVNKELQQEIIERGKLEEALQQANYKLHAMVYEYGLRNQRMSFFNQMSEKLQACISLEETYPIINQFIQKLFLSATGALYMLDSLGNELEAVTYWGKSLSGEKKFFLEDCRALQGRTMHIAVDSRLESCCRHLSVARGRSSICVPLLSQGEIIGMLNLQQHISRGSIPAKTIIDESPEGINEEVQQLATTVADYLALALSNIKLRDTLKQQAIRDPLTGLFNRRYMEETLSREIRRAERYRTPLGIIMVDLDHFRRFNNTFGHDAGDVVLQDMAKFLQNNIRMEDVACRYGGEEFTLIMPGASLDVTEKRAQTIREKVQHLQIYYNNKLLDSITLSLGVAVFPEHGSTGEEVIQAADVALYRAKHEGRNRVIVANNGKTAPTMQIPTSKT